MMLAAIPSLESMCSLCGSFWVVKLDAVIGGSYLLQRPRCSKDTSREHIVGCRDERGLIVSTNIGELEVESPLIMSARLLRASNCRGLSRASSSSFHHHHHDDQYIAWAFTLQILLKRQGTVEPITPRRYDLTFCRR